MKEKDIKKIIRTEIESHIPKSAPKIDFPFVEPKKMIFERKKVLLNLKFAMVTSLVLFMAIGILALWDGSSVNPAPSEVLLKSDHEVISFSAMSSVSLMTSFVNNEPLSYTPHLVSSSTPSVIQYVMPYLKTVEALLSSNQDLKITTQESELPQYDLSMYFETKNLAGTTFSYVMHYNLLTKDLDDETSEYEFYGILLFGLNTFDVEGEKRIEDDEEKVWFKAYKDSNNYIESLYEIEEDKQVFDFKVVQYGVVTSESKYEIEFDGKDIKIELEFIEGSKKGEFEFEYYTENGMNLIKIEFEIETSGIKTSGKMTVQLIVDETTGEQRYRFYIVPDDEDSYEYEFESEDETDDEDVSEPEPTDDEEDEADEEETEESDDEADEDVLEPEPTDDEEDEVDV